MSEVSVMSVYDAQYLHLRVSALAEEVTLGVEMCEPLALGAEPALLLALGGAVGEPVVADDVVLGQVTGPLLPILSLGMDIIFEEHGSYHKVRASVAIATCQE